MPGPCLRPSPRRRPAPAAALSLAMVAAVGLMAAPAHGETDAERLARHFDRVCLAAAPDFQGVLTTLAEIGFQISQPVDGAFEASSVRSQFTIVVSPPDASGAASCALISPAGDGRTARAQARRLAQARFPGRVREEPNGLGGVRFRIDGAAPPMAIDADGSATSGSAIALEIGG